MKKYILILFFLILTNQETSASIKEHIILNLKNINNISFNFEQNINNKVEDGICTIKYPKKILCKYNSKNNKILVSNGQSLVIKTSSSYYLYPLERTPLSLILDKNFLISKVKNLTERIIDEKFINYNFFENDYEINIFFDRQNYNLIGWQTMDIYQNLSITYLNSIIKNQELKENLFELPSQN